MNEVLTNIKSLEIETLKNLKNSKAKNTLRAYQADFKDFSIFCSKNGFNSIPTEPKILSLYLTHLSATSKFSTLKRRIASRILSTNKEKWWTVSAFYSECDEIRENEDKMFSFKTVECFLRKLTKY